MRGGEGDYIEWKWREKKEEKKKKKSEGGGGGGGGTVNEGFDCGRLCAGGVL